MSQNWKGRLGKCAVGLVALTMISGCGKSEEGTPAPAAGDGAAAAPAGAPSAPAVAGAAKPGYAVGTLLGSDGKPISVDGAKLSLAIYGISSKSGEKISYNPKINPDGSFEQKLVDGTYSFSGAQIDVPFNGKHFRFDLEAVGDDKSDRDSDKGIVQNYIWKLTGLRSGQDADESNFTHWHGASVGLQFNVYREDIKKSVPRPPAGTKYTFTLTPTGKLIDGREGKTLTFTRDFDPLMGALKNSNLPDIPIGTYKLSGEEIRPDGTKKPVLIQQAFAKFGDSAEVTFAPGSGTGAWPTNMGFVREE